MDQLVQLYKQIASTANVSCDDAGMMSVTYAGKTMPVVVKGKRLALPTSEALKSSKDKITIFHPLYENIMLNTETEVVSKFRKLLNTRFDYTVGMLFVKLLDLVLNTADHGKLSPDQSEVLSALKNTTDKTFEVLKKLIAESDGLVNIYCKRSGKVENNPFRQASIVTFPLYKELSEKRDKYYGVSVSNKDRETLLKLYRYVFPNIDTPEFYNKGSNSKISPCMDALMKSVITLGTEINDQSALFSNVFDNIEDMTINGDWVPAFENLDALVHLIRSVPMQGSNMIEAIAEDTVAKVIATNTGAIVVNTPVEVEKPTEVVSSNGLKIKGNLFTANSMPAPLVVPQMVQPVTIQQFVAPMVQTSVNNGGAVPLSQLYGNAPVMQQQQYYQQQQPARATLGTTSNGNYQNNNGGGFVNNGYTPNVSTMV